MSELCLRHDLIICSSAIHGEPIMPGHAHIPIATLSPQQEMANCAANDWPMCRRANWPQVLQGQVLVGERDEYIG